MSVRVQIKAKDITRGMILLWGGDDRCELVKSVTRLEDNRIRLFTEFATMTIHEDIELTIEQEV